MKIREVNAFDDLNAISHVYEASWKSAYRGIVPQEYLDHIPEGQWCEALRAPGRHSLILLDGDHVVGTSSYSRSRAAATPELGEIISLYLLPAYWGKGYGGELLRATVNRLAALGFSDLFLWVLEENQLARRCYERNGFTASGEGMELTIGGKRLREVRYIRRMMD